MPNTMLKFQIAKLYTKYIAASIQFALIALYFVFYGWSALAGFVYAAFFALAAPTAVRKTLKNHMHDTSLLFLSITIGTDLFILIMFFANAYEVFGVVFNAGVPIQGLWQHTYFSIVTFTTLGYGDYLPQGFVTQAIAALEALVGFAYFAFILGVTSSIFYARISGKK